jgi:predicted nucleotidyltransferase
MAWMPEHWVDDEGRYDGKRLDEWLPSVVDDVVAFADPLQVIVFGSVARGEMSPDSDIDLLVVVPDVRAGPRHKLMGTIRAAITAPIPVDVFVTDPDEFARRRDSPGSVLYWSAREGRVLYERAA